MYIVASFEHSLSVELAISEIEEAGVPQERILALPLDKRNEQPKLFDNQHYADGVSLLDLAFILGTIGMLFGSIYGFVLPWGPILCGLLGLIGGGLTGFAIKFLIIKNTVKRKAKLDTDGRTVSTEVFIMIDCAETLVPRIEHILWYHHALGVGSLLK